VNAPDRTATILYPDSTTDIASVLELDPHGTTDYSQGLGVRRGEFVLVHQEGTTNGLEKPRVPRIGEVEAWARENPSDGRTDSWRKELCTIGAQIAGLRAAGVIEEYETKQPDIDFDSLQWFGEVMEVSDITQFFANLYQLLVP
jgi:ubiquitin-conjugating enzyme E2 O